MSAEYIVQELTDREQEYLDCSEPQISRGEAARGLTVGFLIGILEAAFSPGNDKGDSRLIKTSRRIRYTRYKKAAERKRDGCLSAKDAKILKKLNSEPFVYDIYDPDEFMKNTYEAYMREHKM